MSKIILCKLTDQNIQTHKGFQWIPGEWAPELSGKGGLCSNSVYHCYEHPLLAVLLNPGHANIKNPRLWLIEVAGEPLLDNGLKRGYKKMRLTEEIPLPEITIEQRVIFAIYCALAVYKDDSFVEWANNWLSNKDSARAVWAAWTVARIAREESRIAWAAAYAAVEAAEASSLSASRIAWAAAEAAMEAARVTNLIEITERSIK